MRLLLVEDNARLAALVRDGLSAQGFVVDWAASLAGAEAALAGSTYDLLLLDLGLPDGDGLALLRSVRQRRDRTPILVLTARGGLDDRVCGLDAGADDYLVKPFQIPELAARCRALLRRPGAVLGTSLGCGNVALDTATRAVTVAGAPVDASPREVGVLEALLRRSGHVVAKAALENALYTLDADVTANALEAAVSRLRKRLAAGDADVTIRTVHGVGYALLAPAAADRAHA
ncbi:response regulator transcription factor [Polymorphobacter fuscus]|uniref:Response regulator n=1 Tax=Sandarakinorhabdus fusca TaxID=1439888 RepID=A0A7C9GZG0_9SPHN|nr:response regulator transcription factor [Polymorphobacter fuscus]KAB7643873.1 response regulator transcription factor [Polymorphobacter fuscus]MQT18574.1 response regulator [Polymorphobacter fuscus]NJC07059.1 DNA-binding response OmpR family regulator [Polymorphobacter fuscus]